MQKENSQKKSVSFLFASLFFRSRSALLESFHASALVENLFFAGKKRVARTADFNIDLRHGRAHGELVTA